MGYTLPPEDPAALRAAAAKLGRLAQDFHADRTAVTTAVTHAVADWRGARKDSFTVAGGGVQVQLKVTSDSLGRAAELLHAYARAVEQARADIAGYDRTAQAAADAAHDPNQPHNSALRSELAAEATTAQANGSALAADARAHVAAVSTRIAGELAHLIDSVVPGASSIPAAQLGRAVDAQLGLAGLAGLAGPLRPDEAWGALTGAIDAVPADAVNADGTVNWTRVFAPAVLPKPGTDPAQVASWWSGLTPTQQAYVIDHDADALGALRGLPSTVADEVNRLRLTAHISALHRQISALGPNDGATRDALQSRLRQDEEILRVVNGKRPGNPQAPILLLAYDPQGTEGQTGVAISYGNPDIADDIGVVVPGTSHSAADLGAVGKNGTDLYTTMSSPSKAVVVWLDGPEPQSLVPDAAEDHWADAASPRLAADLAGLRAAHLSATGLAGHVTAIGHSYGSYILGTALTEGASASVDDVVFVGSPGVGVNHASDLGVDPSHVWDGQAGDPILLVEKRFTPDPGTGNNPEDSDFGDRHFSVSGSHGHSEYYQGESLVNMARIADGDYSAVHTVGAPDYRGLRELAGDTLSTLGDGPYTVYHAGDDLIHGHPLDAGKAVVDGTIKQGKDLLHTGEDVVEGTGSLISDAWDALT